MRVLIVAFHLPPAGNVGALRMGRTVELLLERGHDVRVVTASHHRRSGGSPLNIPERRVTRAQWPDPLIALARISGGSAPSMAAETVNWSRLQALARGMYRNVYSIPDDAWTWTPFAVRSWRRASGGWVPDVILASSGPPSALVVAARIARRFKVPWVADYRDPWSENPYSGLSRFRAKLDRSMEMRVLRTASAITAVSDPLARRLEAMHNKPTYVVLNGYDTSGRMEAQMAQGASTLKGLGDDRLVIRHVGSLYAGRRDPTPLMTVLSSDPRLRAAYRLEFAGVGTAKLEAAAHSLGLNECRFLGQVDHSAALRLQDSSDILLLLTWNNIADAGTVTGKLFEYVQTGRPVLHLGYATGAAAKLIADYQLGETASTEDELSSILHSWLDTYKDLGSLPWEREAPPGQLSRAHQVGKLERILTQVSQGS